MEKSFFDPQADDYRGIDWTDWLDAGEAIAVSTWTISPSDGVTLHHTTLASPITKTFIKGLVAGTTYTLTNHVKTNATPVREDDRSIVLTALER